MIFVLVILLAFESVAAVVSDNDGSAFITKSEFDSLKNDFQSQLNAYNTSIDSKIDTAIAGYLAGISLKSNPVNLYDRVIGANGGPIKWYNQFENTGSSTTTAGLVVNRKRNYTLKWNMDGSIKVYLARATINSAGKNAELAVGNYFNGRSGTAILFLGKPANAYKNDGYLVYTADQKALSNLGVTFKSVKYNNKTYSIIDNIGSGYNKSWKGVAKFLYDKVFKSHFESGTNITAFNGLDEVVIGTGTGTKQDSSSEVKTTPFYTSGNTLIDGSGSAWTYLESPSGTKSLYRYYSTYYINKVYDILYHSYADKSSVTTVTANSYSDTTARSFTANNEAKLGENKYGEKESEMSQVNGGYVDQLISVVSELKDNNIYETSQWGKGAGTNLYAVNQDDPALKVSGNLSTSYTNCAAGSFTASGKTHSFTSASMTVKNIILDRKQLKASSFENSILSGIANEKVYIGGGCPMFQTTGDKDNYDLTFKFSQTDKAGVATTSNIRYELSDSQFKEGTAARKIYSGVATQSNATITIKDIDKNKKIWINCYSETPGNVVSISEFKVRNSTKE